MASTSSGTVVNSSHWPRLRTFHVAPAIAHVERCSKEISNWLAGDLEGYRDGTVAEFCSVTSCAPEQARFFLEANNGEFDRAVSMYFEQGGGGVRESLEGAARSPVHDSATASYQRFERQHRNIFGILFSIPRAALTKGFQIAFGTLRFTASLVGLVGANVLPAPLILQLQGNNDIYAFKRESGSFGRVPTQCHAGSIRSLTEARDVDPHTAASNFARSFSAQYGEQGPHWQVASWSEASSRAHRQFKFLFAYLHSPSHQDTASFCQGTLCDPQVADYVNAHFLCWGGDIRFPNAFELSQGLRVRAYPYVCLLAFSGTRTRVVAAVEGHFSPSDLLPVLREAQDQQAIHLVAEQAEQNERDYNRRLREEQDAEYQRSLEADREREQQRQAASEAQAKARQEAEEAAARQKAAVEAERQRAADKAASIEARRHKQKAALGLEPPAGSPGCVVVRVRLPDGSNHQRRFLSADPLQKAYDFVDSIDNLATHKYSLASSYPRKVFSDSTLQQSFQELGLAPQAVLFVQAEDDE